MYIHSPVWPQKIKKAFQWFISKWWPFLFFISSVILCELKCLSGRCVRFCLIANAHLWSMIDIYMMPTITVFTWINLSLSFLQHISYGILGCGLWWASQLIQLYNAFNSTGRRGSSIAVHSRRDIHLLILTFILMSFGLFNLGFPDFAFKTFVS